MSAQPIRRWDRETALLAWIAACISVFSFLFYFRRGQILLYGDAVAHINIARRLFDSRTPGLLQLGTVWLPLPHLVMVPFLLSDWMWMTGVGGSIPSMAAYVLGTLGIFRLVRYALASSDGDVAARIAPWGAATIYAANPNLIYLQATAMTEAIYLACFIWAVVHFNEFVFRMRSPAERSDDEAASSSLFKCGLCIVAACLTRYDGWFLAAAMCVASFVVILRAKPETKPDAKPEKKRKKKSRQGTASPYRGLRNLVLLAVAAPALWVAYNAIVYRNPLEFANGPYSAKAIEMRTPGASHPGSHDLPVAFSYFLKSGEINLATGNWQRLWIALALAGVLAWPFAGPLEKFIVARFPEKKSSEAENSSEVEKSSEPSADPRADAGESRYPWPLLMLWLPLPFYMLSIAYGGVPVFMPVWWPFSYYNVRYGVELLPAFAVFTVMAVYFMARLARGLNVKIGMATAAVIFVVASYSSIWHDPVCRQEAWTNSHTRVALERELAGFMKAFPQNPTLLMYLGNHVGALQQAGIPLRRVINEGNHRTWKQPVDPDGLWEHALANPAQFADFVIAFEGDPVAASVQGRDLTPLAVIHVTGQPEATIYQGRR